MQHAPIVQLPEQRPHRDWGLILATVAILAIAILTLIVLIQPGWFFAPVESDIATNPELAVFERYQSAPLLAGPDNPELAAFGRYQAAQAAASSIAVPDNPELSAFRRFVELQPGDMLFREDPEVRQFLQWLEGQ